MNEHSCCQRMQARLQALTWQHRDLTWWTYRCAYHAGFDRAICGNCMWDSLRDSGYYEYLGNRCFTHWSKRLFEMPAAYLLPAR